MFDELKKIYVRPKPYSVYSAEALWNDEHISRRMLELHLDGNNDLASRNRDFVASSLAWMTARFHIGAGTRIADFGCGPGLYTTPLAEAGAAVTGIDFSARSIRHAREVAAGKGLAIDYVQQNYLDFASDRRYDLITMIYTDFCALSPAQRKGLLASFQRHLADGGALLLDVCALAAFQQRFETATCEHLLLDGFWSAQDYYAFMNTFKYQEEQLILDKYSIVEAARTWQVYNWLQYYSRQTLAAEFEANGFAIEEWYADVAGAHYREDAAEIAVVARKVSRG